MMGFLASVGFKPEYGDTLGADVETAVEAASVECVQIEMRHDLLPGDHRLIFLESAETILGQLEPFKMGRKSLWLRSCELTSPEFVTQTSSQSVYRHSLQKWCKSPISDLRLPTMMGHRVRPSSGVTEEPSGPSSGSPTMRDAGQWGAVRTAVATSLVRGREYRCERGDIQPGHGKGWPVAGAEAVEQEGQVPSPQVGVCTAHPVNSVEHCEDREDVRDGHSVAENIGFPGSLKQRRDNGEDFLGGLLVRPETAVESEECLAQTAVPRLM